MRCILTLLIVIQLFDGYGQEGTLIPLKGNQTPTYDEIISHYQNLADTFNNCQLIEVGKTDIGKPLHLFVINNKKFKSIKELQTGEKVFLLINNGIHPGEPDGINASILFARNILYSKGKNELQNLVIGIVPVYNVDGCLNRGKFSRANQDGPEEYGFRGNAKNLDLNRDFIKNDSENAVSFTQLFHLFQPHLLIDTHVSDGADYQYTMTMITTQISKLAPELRDLTTKRIEPFLYDYMKKNESEMIPYVNTIGEKPESGIADFLETPRFATGYASLFNVIGFTSETHMLKPFPQRVKATLTFLEGLKEYIAKDYQKIIDAKIKADQQLMNQNQFLLNYSLDTNQFELISFKGYEGEFLESKITGKDRLFYNHDKPFVKDIKYYRNYLAADTIEKPYCYIIPQAWKRVLERLENNNITLHKIKTDTTLQTEIYLINEFETVNRPYEGHYLHKNIEVISKNTKMKVYEGDYVVFTGTTRDRFLIEVLEPHSMDSYFAWNFFDAILQQKEWFSDYVFEDLAIQLLNENKQLKEEFEEMKNKDSDFADNSFLQLKYIYDHSPYKEKSHNLYPIMRVMRESAPETVLIKEIIWR